MKYKVLSLVFGILAIVLGINYYRLYQFSKSVQTPVCAHTEELEKLKSEKESWIEREDVFLKQNAELVNQVNELKMLVNNKPIIIYKHVQKRNINDAASESYTDALEQRYSPNY